LQWRTTANRLFTPRCSKNNGSFETVGVVHCGGLNCRSKQKFASGIYAFFCSVFITFKVCLNKITILPKKVVLGGYNICFC